MVPIAVIIKVIPPLQGLQLSIIFITTQNKINWREDVITGKRF